MNTTLKVYLFKNLSFDFDEKWSEEHWAEKKTDQSVDGESSPQPKTSLLLFIPLYFVDFKVSQISSSLRSNNLKSFTSSTFYWPSFMPISHYAY